MVCHIVTHTGKRFDYIAPKPEMVDIEDIAHALSQTCRFSGHCSEFYSVAQHSVIVSELVPPEHALGALLHDATEAYLPDVPRPAKRLLNDFHVLEERVAAVIGMHFKTRSDDPQIKHADNLALYAEARHFYGDISDWELDKWKNDLEIIPLDPDSAKVLFLDRFVKLYSKEHP